MRPRAEMYLSCEMNELVEWGCLLVLAGLRVAAVESLARLAQRKRRFATAVDWGDGGGVGSWKAQGSGGREMVPMRGALRIVAG